ncbi:hypothetical protein SGPA1_21592 [Streptomyces misionensis JCM 4497]
MRAHHRPAGDAAGHVPRGPGTQAGRVPCTLAARDIARPKPVRTSAYSRPPGGSTLTW